MKRSILATVAALGISCSANASDAGPLPAPKADLPTQSEQQQAVFAAGCFWCVEAVFEALIGVEKVESGYAGGSKANADYKKVAAGATKHAEAVRVTYDPEKISYGKLLHVLFSTHDPTQKNRQGPDVGPQYRSAVFYANPAEKEIARAYIDQLEEAGVFDEDIATTLEPLEAFYPAEDYHQDFVKKHPDHGYVRAWALPKLKKLKKRFPDALKD